MTLPVSVTAEFTGGEKKNRKLKHKRKHELYKPFTTNIMIY